MLRYAAVFLMCLLWMIPVPARSSDSSAPPQVLMTVDTSMAGLINLYHAVVDEHDTRDALVVYPPAMEDLYGKTDNIPAQDAANVSMADGETIHVRLLDASPDAFGAEYMLASLDDNALVRALEELETHMRHGENDVSAELAIEHVARTGAEAHTFRLMNIDPEEPHL